jgi:hypothetical protein
MNYYTYCTNLGMGYRLNYSFQHLVPKGPYRPRDRPLQTPLQILHYTLAHHTRTTDRATDCVLGTETHASGTSAYYRRPGVILLQLARSNGSRPKTTDDKPGTDYVLLPDYTYHRFLYY